MSRALERAAHDVVDAAERLLDKGYIDSGERFVLPPTDPSSCAIEELDDLTNAVMAYDRVLDRIVGVGMSGAEEPAPEPMSGWEMFNKGFNMLFWGIGVIYAVQSAAKLGTWLGVTYGWPW